MECPLRKDCLLYPLKRGGGFTVWNFSMAFGKPHSHVDHLKWFLPPQFHGFRCIWDDCISAGDQSKNPIKAGGKTDVRRRDNVTNLISWACERYGKLDVPVNNAGIGPISPLDHLRATEWEDMIGVNIKGVCMSSRQRCPSSINRVSGISSTLLPHRNIRPHRIRRSIPVTKVAVPSPRVCARRPAINCV
jgi:hypothetical protein